MGRRIGCGETFDGFFNLTCPACAATEKRLKQQTEAIEKAVERAEEETREANRREQEANRDAIEEAAFRIEGAAANAAEEQRQTKAESWKLQAESKSDRAFDLYRAGMYGEAVDLAQRAIKQDPGNIQPYICVAWALQAGVSPPPPSPYYPKNHH